MPGSAAWSSSMAFAALLAGASCTSAAPSVARLDHPCTADSDCSTGICDAESSTCTKTCERHEDCAQLAQLYMCKNAPTGRRCSNSPCSGPYLSWKVDSDRNLCRGTRLEACERAGGCGCTSCEGDSFCADQTCTPRRKVGEKCTFAEECETGECVSGVCNATSRRDPSGCGNPGVLGAADRQALGVVRS